jgi:putative membrane protein
MQIVRTIVWVLLLVALLLFSINNWTPVEVKIWEGLVLETKIPALVVIAFLLGLVPMWLMHRVSNWYFKRRLGSLESAAARAAALAPAPAPAPSPVPPPAAGPAPEELRAEMPPPAEPDPTRP